MGAQESCLFMDFPLPPRWSCLSRVDGSWSTPPVSVWWGRPLSAVSWSGRSSRTTEWSLWRGTSLWTVNTGRSWRSAANVWESLLLYRWCSLMDTTSGSACLCDLYTWSNENQIFTRAEFWSGFVLQGAEKILSMNESGELQDLLIKIEVSFLSKYLFMIAATSGWNFKLPSNQCKHGVCSYSAQTWS